MLTLMKSADLTHAAIAFRHPKIRHLLLAGPPGVGKTTFAFNIAAEIKRQAWKAQLHPESTPSELYGMYAPSSEGGFEWVPGPLDLAYSQGGVLILDEIVEAAGPVKVALYGALDKGKGGRMAYVGREFVPHVNYKVIATMNGVPHEGGLPEALLDRFDATFLITRPGKEQLALLDSDLAELCEDSYEAAKDPIIGPDVSYRMLQSLQELRGILPLEIAVMSACHGNDKLAGSLLEALALLDPPVAVTVTAPAGAVIEDVDLDDDEDDPEEDDEDIDEDDIEDFDDE